MRGARAIAYSLALLVGAGLFVGGTAFIQHSGQQIDASYVPRDAKVAAEIAHYFDKHYLPNLDATCRKLEILTQQDTRQQPVADGIVAFRFFTTPAGLPFKLGGKLCENPEIRRRAFHTLMMHTVPSGAQTTEQEIVLESNKQYGAVMQCRGGRVKWKMAEVNGGLRYEVLGQRSDGGKPWTMARLPGTYLDLGRDYPNTIWETMKDLQKAMRELKVPDSYYDGLVAEAEKTLADLSSKPAFVVSDRDALQMAIGKLLWARGHANTRRVAAALADAYLVMHRVAADVPDKEGENTLDLGLPVSW